MKAPLFLVTALGLSMLAACDSPAEKEADAVEDRVERQADASAAAAGNTPAALGLTEAQLLDADLVTADGSDLGDIQQVRRNAAGAVEGFLVELDNTDPDRTVLIPLSGLTTRVAGSDTDLQTTMTAADLAALPDVLAAPR